MRVVLIDATVTGQTKRPRSRWVPLGLAYLAASLRRAGHEVWLHNRLNLQAWDELSLAEVDGATEHLLRSVAPDMIGISVVTPAYADAFAVAEIARQTCPDATIVLGGAHTTAVPVETLERIAAADCAVAGEGEERIVQLAAGTSPADLPGVAWRDAAGGVRLNAWEPPGLPPDELPLPARDLLDMRQYIRHSRATIRGSYLRCTNMLSARGCLHRCAFCSEPAYSIRGYRAHSAERVIQEARQILSQYRVPLLVFSDEDFTANRERVMRLLEAWRGDGLHGRVKFAIQARADRLDDGLLGELKRAGCHHIEIGIESGSDRVLKLMNKGCTVAQNAAAAEMVQRAGIMLQINLICGTPTETEEELRGSLALVEELHPHAASIGPLMLFPGTAFARQLVAEGSIAPDFWDIRDRESPQPVRNLSAMDDDTFVALCREGRELAARLNSASVVAGQPLWRRAARRVKHGVMRAITRPGSTSRGR